MGYCRKVIHRDVATVAEFQHYVGKWCQKQYSDFRLGYFAFHGDPAKLNLSAKESVSLEDLRNEFAGRLTGRTLYFGACATMAALQSQLMFDGPFDDVGHARAGLLRKVAETVARA